VSTKDVSQLYKEVQVDPLTPAPSGISDFPISEIIDQIHEWFFTNFEDPSNSTPYDGREGGFQYIWGGPYNTKDIIENIFADELSEEQIEAVIDAIDTNGFEWVPNSGRLQAPDEDEDGGSSSALDDPVQIHSRMLLRITEVEEQLRQLSQAQGGTEIHGIGHNKPPEPIDDSPATRGDIQELRKALETLKLQPPIPDTQGQQDAEAAKEKVESVASKISVWLGTQANNFVTEFMKEAGKESGKWASRLAIWSTLGSALAALAGTVGHWLNSIHFPF